MTYSSPHRPKSRVPQALFSALLLLSLMAPTASFGVTPQDIAKFKALSPADQQALKKKYLKTKGATPTKPAAAAPVKMTKRSTGPQSSTESEARASINTPTLGERAVPKSLSKPIKQFGYDLFAGSPTTFAPANDIPIPRNYILGPGDMVEVMLFGKDNESHSLPVSRDGVVHFPGIGPITAAGLSFSKFEAVIKSHVRSQKIGTKVTVTLGALRSIRIFVLGDVFRPGSYTISALSTLTNALFVSGGIKKLGSLRNIQLKRRGRVITRLDLYDLLLQGSTRNDHRLQPGDVIFVPPIGKTTGIAGHVKRPAIYELRKEKSAAALVELAGGLLPSAFPAVSQLERIDAKGHRVLLDVNLTQKSGKKTSLRDGDVLRVYSILDKMENIVLLTGHLQRPGGLQWKKDMRLTDAIPSLNDLLPEPDLGYVVIEREVLPERSLKVLTVDLGKALTDPKSPENLLLRPRDRIFVFSIHQQRAKALAGLVTRLKRDTRFNQPARVTQVKGHVQFPGTYPLVEGMRGSDLIRASFGIRQKTDLGYALLTRETPTGDRIEVRSLSLASLLEKPHGPADPVLQPQDTLYIFPEGSARPNLGGVRKRLSQQARHGEPVALTSIAGRVIAPAKYPLIPGMRVADLVAAGGGLQESAYTELAELTRYAIEHGSPRITRHISIHLGKALKGVATENILLQPHDVLRIKAIPEWHEQEFVTITGEVNFPGRITISRGETLRSALERVGGLTPQSHAFGAVFIRPSVLARQQKEINRLTEKLEFDIATIMQGQQSGAENAAPPPISLLTNLLDRMRQTQPSGRMVVDVEQVLNNEAYDVILHDGDKLYIPPKHQEVSVIGEVHYPTSHLHQAHLGNTAYIQRSGGYTDRADADQTYVVQANGAVIAGSSPWFRDSGTSIQPGDTIVVPMDVQGLNGIQLWSNISQIVYQLAISSASLKFMGIF